AQRLIFRRYFRRCYPIKSESEKYSDSVATHSTGKDCIEAVIGTLNTSRFSCALARQKQRSICFCLEFLCFFLFSRKERRRLNKQKNRDKKKKLK
ncbi:MAG: hypothetical protein M3342_09420, partial [Bacteroidota bacterium]|nr:hypothetical protein [Bacteroidota bacterium]